MAVEHEVLGKLLKYGISKKYFEIVTIGKLKESCCKKSKIEIIDFDKTKEKIVEEFELATLKSCDALRIMPTNKCIDFIEIKSSKDILNRRGKNLNVSIEDRVNNFDFQGKIRESLIIISNIVSKNDNKFSGKERDMFFNIKKNYIILTDISPEENPEQNLLLNLSYLSEFSSPLSVLFKEKLDRINPDQLNNLQKPILMGCESFERYYEKVAK
jgi:hypothetical protein